MSNEIRQLIDERPFSRLQLRVVLICFALNMLDGFDVLAIAFTAPTISQEWQLTPYVLGIIFSAGLVGMTLGAAFIAPYSDVIGRRAMILLSLLAIGLSMALTGLTTNANQMIIMRVVTGLGIGSILASLTSIVAEYTPVRKRNLAVGFMQVGYPLGATAGGFAAVWLIQAYGWSAVFYCGSALSLAAAIMTWFFLPESLEFLSSRRPPGALDRINGILARMGWPTLSAIPEAVAGVVRPSVKRLLTPEYRNWTLLLWCGFFMAFLTLYFLFSWVPKITVDAGLSVDKGIYIGTALNFGAFLGGAILGYLSDRLGVRPLIIVFFAGGVISMVAFGFAPAEVGLLLALAFVLGFCVLGGFVGFYISAARLYPTEIRTTGVGWSIGAGRTGAIIGPYLGGVLINMGYSSSVNFVVFAVPLILSCVAIYLLRAPALEPVGNS